MSHVTFYIYQHAYSRSYLELYMHAAISAFIYCMAGVTLGLEGLTEATQT